MNTRRPARRRPADRAPREGRPPTETAQRENLTRPAPRAPSHGARGHRPSPETAQRENLTRPAPRAAPRRASRPAIARAEGGDRPGPSLRLLGLLLVLTVALAVLYPTLRHAVEQREELREVTAQVEEARERTRDLERRQRLWDDPDYVRAQARDRLGYVMPGETTLVVIDPQTVTGTPRQTPEDRAAEAARRRAATTPWYVNVWESIAAAGQAGTPTDTPGGNPPPSTDTQP